jgi:cystathionine beta-lyase/cystathionine gamma-synthase
MPTIEEPEAGGHGRSTTAVHAGGAQPRPGAPVVNPVVQTTTFFTDAEPSGEILYTRYGKNPNQVAVAVKLAALEGTDAALVLSSGMAAIAMTFLGFAGSGDHIVAARELYGGTLELLEHELPRLGIETTFVGGGNGWSSAFRERTRVLYVETLSNPLLRVADLPALSRLAHDHGVPLVVDATFTTPINLRAASLGADVVVHSATKYFGGHSDVTAGIVAGPGDVIEEVRRRMRVFGASLDPHAAWLLERGLKTLAVRVERQNASALELARRLESHVCVRAVHYPGLATHPDHDRASSLLDGFGGVLGIEVAGADTAALRTLGHLRVMRVAPSLGGVETLVSMPAFTSHASLGAEERRQIGIGDGFVRISVGIEDVEDLWTDLSAALERGGNA